MLIQWNVAWGQPDPTPYWPGAYDATSNPGGVDVISIEFLSGEHFAIQQGGKQSAWALAQSGVTIDLDWMVAYAQKNGVKIALSEYGAGSSSSNGETSGTGLDDGTWTAALNRLDERPAPGLLPLDRVERRRAGRRHRHGQGEPQGAGSVERGVEGNALGGSWWTGTAPP